MNTEFKVADLHLQGLKEITPFFSEDERGYFLKSIEKEVFARWGLNVDVCEDFESYSVKGVIRGLHFQTHEPQIKIIHAVIGEIHDVVVDLRKNSLTYGQYEEVLLSDSNHKILWIPKGFAHGFEVLSGKAVVAYRCIGRYYQGYDSGIRWNDETLAISWQTEKPIVSQKDRGLMSFQEFAENIKGL